MSTKKIKFPAEHAALQKAIDKAEGQSALAKLLGQPITQSYIWVWLHRDHRCRADYVIKVEKATGVSRHELRPDLYPIEESYPTPAA